MKKILIALCLACICCTGCSILNPDDPDGKALNLSGPDGNMKLESFFKTSPSELPGCVGISAHTGGIDVWDHLILSFYFAETTPVGKELQLKYLSFCAPLSSDSANYTNTFSGKMILKEWSAERIVIRMDDVRFRIAHGEYSLEGDLVARIY